MQQFGKGVQSKQGRSQKAGESGGTNGAGQHRTAGSCLLGCGDGPAAALQQSACRPAANQPAPRLPTSPAAWSMLPAPRLHASHAAAGCKRAQRLICGAPAAPGCPAGRAWSAVRKEGWQQKQKAGSISGRRRTRVAYLCKQGGDPPPSCSASMAGYQQLQPQAAAHLGAVPQPVDARRLLRQLHLHLLRQARLIFASILAECVCSVSSAGGRGTAPAPPAQPAPPAAGPVGDGMQACKDCRSAGCVFREKVWTRHTATQALTSHACNKSLPHLPKQLPPAH